MGYKKFHADYETVIGTSFWNDYIHRIIKRVGDETQKLITMNGNDISRVQGFIQALNWVMGLPDKMIEEMSGKSE